MRYATLARFSFYRVSDEGVVQSSKSGKWKDMKPSRLKSGYEQVTLCATNGRPERIKVHRLVLLAFVGPPPDGCEACHNNGVRWDNRLCNLRWASKKENQSDRIAHGTKCEGEKHPMAKLTLVQVEEIRQLIRRGLLQKAIAAKFGVDRSLIGQIRKGKIWRKAGDL